jgi:hypothetical protein
MSILTRETIMLVILLLSATSSACLYVAAVFYRAWTACGYFGLTFFVCGVFAVVMLARVLR